MDVMQKKCNRCGFVVNEKDNFCPRCGGYDFSPIRPDAPNSVRNDLQPKQPQGYVNSASSDKGAKKKEKGKLFKNKKFVATLCVLLSVAIIGSMVAIGFELYEPKTTGLTGMEISGDTDLVFSDDVKVIDAKSAEKNFQEAYINENGEYVLHYSKSFPAFFEGLQIDDVFCVAPNDDSKKAYFQSGFCGRVVSIDEAEKTIIFKIPTIEEVFKEFKLSTEENNIESIAFIPADGTTVESQENLNPTVRPLGTLDDFSLDADIFDATYKKNDLTPLMDGYTILAKELELGFDLEIGDNLELSGEVVFEYPSVKYLLDVSTDEEGNTIVNDFNFDFKTQEKLELSVKAKGELGLSRDETIIEETIGVVGEIVDTTKSESGKYVLGTYLLGYEVPLPSPFMNSANQVSPLSLGVAIQLAITANGEISYECTYSQMGYVEISANANGEAFSTIKGYDYPNPVVDSATPTGSFTEENPSVTVSGKGKIDLKAGTSVDVGVCILGMIPLKVTTGVEAKYVSIHNIEENITIIENSYVKTRDVSYFSVDVYSDLLLHFGVKTTLVQDIDHFKIGARCQLFRKTLYRMPEAVDFTIDECEFAGVKLGEIYSDEELEQAIKDYNSANSDYSIVDKFKDETVNSVYNGMLESYNITMEELLAELQADLPSEKIDVFISGMIVVRNSENRVISLILMGSDFSNTSGFKMGMEADEIIGVYGNPQDRIKVEYDVSLLLSLFTDVEQEELDVELMTYKTTDGLASMDIILSSGDAGLAMLIYNM